MFIGVQLENLFTSNLPTAVEEVASLVKNGFWQLFIISIFNILFFFIYYKRTNSLIQKILIAFILASVVLLISAGNKMFLYVYDYGFSYEKFFASYTVLYFGVLFVAMI
jgi:hypothetical protein